jgi:hypothetical protein
MPHGHTATAGRRLTLSAKPLPSTASAAEDQRAGADRIYAVMAHRQQPLRVRPLLGFLEKWFGRSGWELG